MKSIWTGFRPCGRAGATELTCASPSDWGQGGMLDGGKVGPLTKGIRGTNERENNVFRYVTNTASISIRN